MWFIRFDWEHASAVARMWVAATHLYRSEDGREGCAYFEGGDVAPPVPGGASLVRLRLLQDLRGAAMGQDARWHYVVATDVLAGQEDDFNAWYEREHLPGLAAVPGTARAARYEIAEGPGPRYHACYDLAERSASNSPEWLAVRATPWSSRVRPAFLNTRRTMYERIEPPSSATPPAARGCSRRA
jgi:hypothetical protein